MIRFARLAGAVALTLATLGLAPASAQEAAP